MRKGTGLADLMRGEQLHGNQLQAFTWLLVRPLALISTKDIICRMIFGNSLSFSRSHTEAEILNGNREGGTKELTSRLVLVIDCRDPRDLKHSISSRILSREGRSKARYLAAKTRYRDVRVSLASEVRD